MVLKIEIDYKKRGKNYEFFYLASLTGLVASESEC